MRNVPERCPAQAAHRRRRRTVCFDATAFLPHKRAMDSGPVSEWLAGPAGLSGKKLEAALAVCEEEVLETVGDLRGMAESVATLEEIGFKKVYLSQP